VNADTPSTRFTTSRSAKGRGKGRTARHALDGDGGHSPS
jgi:hypothetical protein